MTGKVKPEIQSALAEVARCQAWCKQQYYFALVDDEPELAASYSRQAAAYEYAHAVFAKAVGANSEWANRGLKMNIGNICNYYGGVDVQEEDGKYFWGIDDWDDTRYEEIPKYLYDALVKYQTERKHESGEPENRDHHPDR